MQKLFSGYSVLWTLTRTIFEDAKTNPLQLYGKTKRDGEEAAMSMDRAKVIVLRVPVLYVPT